MRYIFRTNTKVRLKINVLDRCHGHTDFWNIQLAVAVTAKVGRPTVICVEGAETMKKRIANSVTSFHSSNLVTFLNECL